jgi:hypothetical protein
MEEEKNIHNVFWTGGLDSTFRIIHLLITGETPVQPHYVIRHEESTGTEIDTMNNIRREAIRLFPEIRSRFLPTIYINEDLIPESEEINGELKEMRKEVRVHEQYEILARYCKAYNVNQIELTYEQDFHLDPDKVNVSHYFGKKSPFLSISNPHKSTSKLDYYIEAKANGWQEILNMTHFCRRPRKKIVPCGICGPCGDVVDNRVGFRLPIIPRIKARILLPFRKYWRKNYLRHEESKFLLWVKRRFEGKF